MSQTAKTKPARTGPESPSSLVVIGAFFAAVGAGLVAMGASEGTALAVIVGCGLAFVGWVVILVGIIAMGVRRGMALVDHDRSRRS